MSRHCTKCWFSGMELATPNPHGPLRWCCALTGGRLPPARTCDSFAPDRDRCFTTAELEAARARRAA